MVIAEEATSLAITAAHRGVDLGAGPGDTWERTRFDASWLDRGNAGVLAAMHPYVDSAYAHYSHFYPNGGANIPATSRPRQTGLA